MCVITLKQTRVSPSVPVLPLAADTATCKQVAEHKAGAWFPQQRWVVRNIFFAAGRLSKRELLWTKKGNSIFWHEDLAGYIAIMLMRMKWGGGRGRNIPKTRAVNVCTCPHWLGSGFVNSHNQDDQLLHNSPGLIRLSQGEWVQSSPLKLQN